MAVTTAIALDLGTTSIKAGLLGSDNHLIKVQSDPAPEMTIHDGKYESDGMVYLQSANRLLESCLADVAGKPPLGLCSQRSSFLIWDQATGVPVTKLISWQDNRGAECCALLRDQDALIKKMTGLHLAPYYFAPKVHGLLKEQPELLVGLNQRKLLIGTLDSFLIWHWSGGKYHQTDMSMAARTLLMDIRTRQWSENLCELFDIPVDVLPDIRPSMGLEQVLYNGVTLRASVADQSAALVAIVRERQRDVLVNLGTGCFVVAYLSGKNHQLPAGYLQKLVYQDVAGKVHFAAEGTLNSISAALQGYPYRECSEIDPATRGIFCLAEPSGIGAPYFREDLGLIYSQPVDHLSKHQITGLLLEGIIFRVVGILDDFYRLYDIRNVYLSGGLSSISILQQGIAQCSPVVVHKLLQKDSSLHGSAMMAAGFRQEFRRQSVKVAKSEDLRHLQAKYQRWKIWLDDLLSH